MEPLSTKENFDNKNIIYNVFFLSLRSYNSKLQHVIIVLCPVSDGASPIHKFMRTHNNTLVYVLRLTIQTEQGDQNLYGVTINGWFVKWLSREIPLKPIRNEIPVYSIRLCKPFISLSPRTLFSSFLLSFFLCPAKHIWDGNWFIMFMLWSHKIEINYFL